MLSQPTKSRKVLLVYPGNIKSISKRLPLSVLYLAESLLERGFEPLIWDMQVSSFTPEYTKEILAAGISTLTGRQILHGLEAATLIRRHAPVAPIIWGGIHPTLMPEETLAHDLVDYVVQGEGEATLPELLQAIASAQSPTGIQGVVWKDGDKTVVNPRRPFINFNKPNRLPYELLLLSRYQTADQFEYQSSRGCPFGCLFCYNKKFNFFNWRSKDAAIVLDELQEISERFGSRNIHFVDDEFFIDRKRALAITRGIAERKLKFRWKPAIRIDAVNRFDREFFEALEQSGCYEFCMGAESGSDRILTLINKKISREDIIASARHIATMKIGIKPQYSFLSGFPGETEKDLEATMDCIDELWKIDPGIKINGLFIATPFPGTGFYEKALSYPDFTPPASLEEWGQTNYLAVRKKIPYLEKNFYRKLKVFSTIIFFLYLWQHTGEQLSKNTSPQSGKHRQFRTFRFLLRPFHAILLWRWKKRAVLFPLDVEIIRKILLYINP